MSTLKEVTRNAIENYLGDVFYNSVSDDIWSIVSGGFKGLNDYTDEELVIELEQTLECEEEDSPIHELLVKAKVEMGIADLLGG
jgi:hypothetical protein